MIVPAAVVDWFLFSVPFSFSLHLLFLSVGVSDGCRVAFRARMWASKLSSCSMHRAVGSTTTPTVHVGDSLPA